MYSVAGGAEPSEPTGAAERRASPRRSSRGGARALAGLAVAGAFVALAAYFPDTGPLRATPLSSAKQSVIVVTTPDRPPILAAASFDDERSLERLAAEKDPTNGEARDLYGNGAFAGKSPWVRIEARWDVNSPRPVSLFVDLAETAARMGAVVVKLGDGRQASGPRAGIEWAHATVSAQGATRECLGYRLTGSDDKRLAGFYCGAAAVGDADLACLVDHWQLASNGKLTGFDNLLRGAPDKRGACRPWSNQS